MAFSIYPDETALRRWLVGASLKLGDMPLDWAIRAGISAFQEACGRHFLAGKDTENNVIAETTRLFDPPVTQDGVLWLGAWNDLATATSVIYQPSSTSTPQTLASGTDYWFEPRNDPARGRPYTRLKMLRRWRAPVAYSLQQAIRITGLWGYGTVLPDDVHRAMLSAGALAIVGELQLIRRGGMVSWRASDGTSVSYDPKELAALCSTWQGRFDAAVARWRIVDV